MDNYCVTFESYLQDPSIVFKLNPSSKTSFYRKVRDLYIEASRTKSEKLINLIKQILKILPPYTSMTYTHIYSMSPFPSCIHTTICKKSVLACTYSIKKMCELYVYFKNDSNNLEYIFISPNDLSYHNLQNVINIDSQLRFILSSDFNLKIQGPALLFKRIPGVWKLELEKSCVPLLELDSYDLYLKPIHKINKDGYRVSINSPFLTEMINKIIVDSGIPELKKDFVSANTIIRYNKFFADPEENFVPINHNDSQVPIVKKYPDADINCERSKYVVLIYLTAPKTQPNRAALKFNETENLIIKRPFTCIIYDHRLEVVGQPYMDTDQIFIRTELIYISKACPPNKSKLFDIACYDIKESLYHEEFNETINDMFDRVNALRYLDCNQLNKMYILKSPLYCNSIKDINFIVHGKHYYFLSNVNIKTAVSIILLDYFSKKYDNFGNYNFKEHKTSQELSSDINFTIKTVTKYLTSLAKIKPESLTATSEDSIAKIEDCALVTESLEGYNSNDNAETCISDNDGSDNNIISDDDKDNKEPEPKPEPKPAPKPEPKPEPKIKLEHVSEPPKTITKVETKHVPQNKVTNPKLPTPKKQNDKKTNDNKNNVNENENDDDDNDNDKSENQEDISFAYEIDYNPSIPSDMSGPNDPLTWYEKKKLEEKLIAESKLRKTLDTMGEEKCAIYRVPINNTQKIKEVEITDQIIFKDLELLKNASFDKYNNTKIIKSTLENLLSCSVIVTNKIININKDNIDIQDGYIKLSSSDSSTFDIITIPNIDIIAYKLPDITYDQYNNLHEFSIESFDKIKL